MLRRAKKSGGSGDNGNTGAGEDRSGGYDSCIPFATVPSGIIGATCTTESDLADACPTGRERL